MTDTRSLSEDGSILAAEFALGLLEGRDRFEAAARVGDDGDFRDEVARWRGRLAPLLDGIADAEPPRSAWKRIEQLTPGTAANDNVAELKSRIRLWRGFSAGASAIAAALAFVLLFQRPEPVPIAPAPQETPAPRVAPMVASLASDKGEPMLMATWDPVSERLIIASADPMPAPAGRSHEVWLIPSGGTPMKVAMLPPSARMHMQVPDEIADALRNGATLAVSVEPPGGSPTGLPTGPVIASGALETS